MSNIATTISQSRKLIELGLDPNSADMVWTTANPDLPMLLAYPIEDCNSWNDKVPAWSLPRLLDMMPKELEPDIQRHPSTGEWFASVMFQEEPYSYLTHDYYNPVDAAYEMVCWLLEQGLIEKGGNNETE